MAIRVCYDYQIFIDQLYGGISRYVYELALRVQKAEGFSPAVVAPFYKNRYLRKEDGLVRGFRLPGQPLNRRVYRYANWLASPLLAGFSGADIIHETYYDRRTIPVRHKAVVLTVYDMIHERFREMFPAGDDTIPRKKAAIARADHIICISESTRRDLLQYYDLPEAQVSVIHLAGNEPPDLTPEVAALDASRPFVLFVGSRRGYKNFEGLLRAYAASALLRRELSLVCFGGGPFEPDEISLMAELGVDRDRVVQLGGSDDVLHALYKKALIFVFPSLYEGFGLPLLEAMNAGCPVACSNSSSLPEVAGAAAQYFEPGEVDSIRNALEGILLSDARRADLIALGAARAAEFSWDLCAEKTMATYRRTIGL